MTNAALINTDGKKTWLDRYVNTTPTRSKPLTISFGAEDQAPSANDIDLDVLLPTSDTVLDALDATTGWAQGGDGDAPVLNTTTGERREGTGSVNIPSTFSAGTSNWDKTVSSTDLDGQYLYIYVFFSTTAYASLTAGSDAVRVVLGTSGFTNINNYDFDKANINSNDWTLLFIDIDNPTSTGGSGAVETTIDRIRMQYKAGSSIGTNNARMDWWHYATVASTDVGLVASYPITDFDNLTATYRSRVGASTMVNYDITNLMLKNSDATKLAQATGQFDEVVKTDKIIFVGQPKVQVT